jgi:predicted GH43/DUF377 family glycosyl hydrolase
VKDFRNSRHADLARLETQYKRSGDVNAVVFPRGQTIGADGDTINIYYGAACDAMWNTAISMEGISE